MRIARVFAYVCVCFILRVIEIPRFEFIAESIQDLIISAFNRVTIEFLVSVLFISKLVHVFFAVVGSIISFAAMPERPRKFYDRDRNEFLFPGISRISINGRKILGNFRESFRNKV